MRKDRINLRWTMHYIGDHKHDLDSEPSIPAHASHDLVLSFTTHDERLTFDAALINAGDQEPPRVYRQIN